MHETFRRKAGKLASQQARNFRLIDFERAGSLSLGKPPRTDGLADANRKIGLRKTLLGIGQADVGEGVPAAPFASLERSWRRRNIR